MKYRLPNITGSSENQLRQMKSYLYQLVQELNVAADTGGSGGGAAYQYMSANPGGSGSGGKSPTATFNDIKALIIKSADIVNAYYDTISRRLDGVYVAQSEFGTYSEETSQRIEENSTGITRAFESIQTITGAVEEIADAQAKVSATIKTGALYYDENGFPVYGLEVGQVNSVDGNEVFKRFARFTAARLSFYDQNDAEVAYISNSRLYIANAEITGTLKLGGFLIDTSNGLTVKYVGRG